ncbi:hypothetical protein [Burkholderia vietnamiensis]|uniref:hypothetical protein n=1 Tax=Burkholderia vietnamiensis TaxID=60552 RepID=UPI0012D8801F|nr:hypothetical protein [Burkholderia vietnamiensis]
MDAKEAKKIQRQINRLFKHLTTPTAITFFIREFCRGLSDQDPFFIDCQPETWSRQSCCDMNVDEYIRIQGRGAPLYGFRIWFNKNPVYVEAESHVIWRDGDELRDVSFCADGETRTLFLPADSRFGGTLDDLKKSRCALLGPDKRALAFYEDYERSAQREQLPRDVAWNVMPTWEEWQNGKRAPDVIHGVAAHQPLAMN